MASYSSPPQAGGGRFDASFSSTPQVAEAPTLGPPLKLESLRPAATWSRPEEEDPDMVPPADLTEKFEIHWNSTIGEGAFSTVRECTEISTGEKFAIKIIDMRPLKIRRSFALTRVLREVTIMKSLEHENIVKLKAMYHTKAVLWLVQELANGGELFQAIARLGPFPEACARSVIRQVMSAIKYLHDRGTVHRDIKPENIMLSFKGKVRPLPGSSLVDANPIVKLVDFGLAKMLGEEHSAAKTMLGTPQYIAPEVLLAAHDHSRSYGFPVDCWSVGVVLYLVLAGRFPFEGSSDSQTDSMIDVDDYTEFRILHGSFEFDPSEWGHVTNAAKHLVCGLLTVDPSARLSMEQALNHPWITGIGMDALPAIPDRPTFNDDFIAHSSSYAFLAAGGAPVNPSAGISRSGSQNDVRSGSAAGGGPSTAPGVSLVPPQPPVPPTISGSSHGSLGQGTPNSATSAAAPALPASVGGGTSTFDFATPVPPRSFGLHSGMGYTGPPIPLEPPAGTLPGPPYYSSEAGFAGLSSVSGYRHDGVPPPLHLPVTPSSSSVMSSPAPLSAVIPTHHSYHGMHVHVQHPSAIPSSHSSSFAESRSSQGQLSGALRASSVTTEESGERSATYLLNYATDAKGVLTQVSESLAELLGYSRATLIGKHAAQIVSVASADVFQMLEVTGSCLNTPVQMVHANGSTMEFLMSAKSTRNLRGGITGFTMSLSQMEEVSDEPMINVLDSRGVFVSASDSWLEWLGLGEEEVSGRKLTEYLTQSCRDNFSNVLLPAVRVTGSSSSVILHFVSKSGTILPAWVDIVATRRRGVVHRLEVTVTPQSAAQAAEDAAMPADSDDALHDDGDGDDDLVVLNNVAGGSEGSLDIAPAAFTGAEAASGTGSSGTPASLRAAGGGPYPASTGHAMAAPVPVAAATTAVPPSLGQAGPPPPLALHHHSSDGASTSHNTLDRTLSELSVVDDDDDM